MIGQLDRQASCASTDAQMHTKNTAVWLQSSGARYAQTSRQASQPTCGGEELDRWKSEWDAALQLDR